MTRGARTLLVLIVALTAAGGASFAVYRAVQGRPAPKVELATRPVVVAAKAIPVGSLLAPADLKVLAFPADSVVSGAVTKPEDAVGRALMTSVAENDPITEMRLAQREAGGGLAVTIPPGMRGVSVKVNEVISVAGFVGPASHVDVLVAVTEKDEARARTVVNNVKVLAANTRYDAQEAKDGKPIPATVVTLLATPEDAEKIHLASTEGKILLALRNPLDDVVTNTPGVRLASLMGPPAPPPVEKTVKGRRVVVAAPPPPPPTPKAYVVETIRGAKRSEEVVR